MLLWLSLATETVSGQAYPIRALVDYFIKPVQSFHTLLNHNLVSNSPPGRIVRNPMLLGEFTN